MSKEMIKVENLSKLYTLYNNPKDRLFDLVRFNKRGEKFFALKDVSFKAYEGEVIGFVGVNGSGKSTLSNIIAGITPRTNGSLEVHGETALIAVSAGLNNELSGRENIELKLLMLGFTKKQIQELEPGIIEFSELEKFIDQPVKSYSSGMKSRLGFAISVNVNPDVLIIDEALSVGDKAFAEKSLKKMNEFKAKGKTMIFVSHSLGQMKKFCTKILWLEFGKVKMYGDVDTVLKEYESFLDVWKTLNNKEKKKYQKELILPKRSSKTKIENKKAAPAKKEVTNVLCHLKGKNIIYIKDNEQLDGNHLIHKVYYSNLIKTDTDKKYYLLREFSTNELIGWVSSEFVTASPFGEFSIPEFKKFSIKSDVNLYSAPWGGKKQIVTKTDESLTYTISKACMVQNDPWFYISSTQGAKNYGWLHCSDIDFNDI
ncbi:hypothetical protein ACA30_04195 [Virgibacillus soli]|nr:hypothetical protein ACA30_04195 [Virgibacillus soli]